MVDIREVMQHGNKRLERLLEKLSDGTGKGIYKATNSYLTEMIDSLSKTETPEKEGLRAEDGPFLESSQIEIASKTTGGIILAAFKEYQKREIKISKEELDEMEIDFDSEDAPDIDIPESILDGIVDSAVDAVSKDLGLDIEFEGIIKGILSSPVSKNFVKYIMVLVMMYAYSEAASGILEDADLREERTAINVPDEEGDFSDMKFEGKDFSEFFKSEWFNQLRR
tara:strand:+ start:613 stop:1287 length:675 start_codon:yes stop_codon:yes gene_type:complete